MFNTKDVTESVRKGSNNWSLKITHRPTGLFVSISGSGRIEHQLEEKRAAYDNLENQVNQYYIKEYNDNNKWNAWARTKWIN